MDALHPAISPIHHQEILQKSAEQAELIEQLLSIGAALSGSHDLEELLNLILSKSREITCSDAGSVYLVDRSDESPKLVFKTAQNDSIPAASFREFAMPLTPASLAGYVAITGESLNISDAYELPKTVPYQLDRNFDRDFSYRTRSVLVLPMQNQEGEITGVLQLINRKIQPNVALTEENTLLRTKAYSAWEENIVRSLASQAAISIERNQLQESIENLFEGFVKASIQVIEARDPTTYGHSERVAELTVGLSLEATSVNAGPLRSIYFSDRQIQEIRYAALLHDFGKIGVPEAILGKRKKLYPEQLDVIRHRFALAQRTLEMECAHSKFQYLIEHPFNSIHSPAETQQCLHCQKLSALESQLQSRITQLNRYWDLLLDLNEPEAIQTREFQALSEAALAELVALSESTYRDIDGQLKPLVTPEEMAQLMVPRGNLTPQERLAIEAHVTHSYEFLKRIPWTKHLKQVPNIAYGHHEKLDGSGYPRGLVQDEIPIQTQIMSIADIYDALTASDRPYKRRLPVDVVLNILRAEAGKNKINTDLVELFEQRQVYKVLGHSAA
ncbi:HD domain-containing phosphohydrolase [Kamptonema cortianum]|uniref:HD domain-containing phosphohydrolase n=1 Tax=Geitlerinema calcuttense NRMC-F 0142 TaxID=2922238 RepID=A0ABT7LZF1_9CYAN|nr:HD family phosphohydrolase [Geitlerinema calcuttense]MDK3155160.1 HD domain-containing phosphohydrolase [Kamptonema cortianum]MDL5057179.1 HD domain-containing phosphohydrolase [Geitlerinema calcuttense NRMC-F 0142]